MKLNFDEHMLHSFKTTAKFTGMVLLGVIAVILVIITAVLSKGISLFFVVFFGVWAIVHHEQKEDRKRRTRLW